jgi:multidrug efflux pump subunit AcrA (membrane-fusion protein)
MHFFCSLLFPTLIMKRTLSFSAVIAALLFAGCGASPAGKPSAPASQVPVTITVSSSSTARSSDAEPLGMTQAEIRSEISEGKSIKDILKSRGIKVPASSAANN